MGGARDGNWHRSALKIIVNSSQGLKRVMLDQNMFICICEINLTSTIFQKYGHVEAIGITKTTK